MVELTVLESVTFRAIAGALPSELQFAPAQGYASAASGSCDRTSKDLTRPPHKVECLGCHYTRTLGESCGTSAAY